MNSEEVKIIELKQTTRGVIVTFEYTSPYQKPKGQIFIPTKIFEDREITLGSKMLIKWVSQ